MHVRVSVWMVHVSMMYALCMMLVMHVMMSVMRYGVLLLPFLLMHVVLLHLLARVGWVVHQRVCMESVLVGGTLCVCMSKEGMGVGEMSVAFVRLLGLC